MPSVCFVAGDPSGDAHAAQLIEALKRQDASLTFAGLGGPVMQRAGMTLLDDLTKAAAIGPFDAAKHLASLLRAKRLLDKRLKTHRPDLVILVDFGDFNLPIIAPMVKRHGIPILYYISPQLWAWGGFRLRYVRRYVDRMLVFFSFEETFYKREGIPVTWVGHPLMDQVKLTFTRDEAFTRFGLNAWRRTVGLLPGSRIKEVTRHLPLMLSAARRIAWRMPGVQFLLLKAPGIRQQDVAAAVSRANIDVQIVEDSLADSAQCMDAAIVASGTATLELALCGVPMVVVYRTSWPTYLAARSVVRIPYIALVNVVAGRAVVPELLQHQVRPKRIAPLILRLLRDDEEAARMKADLQAVRARLGEPDAAERAAGVVLELLKARL